MNKSLTRRTKAGIRTGKRVVAVEEVDLDPEHQIDTAKGKNTTFHPHRTLFDCCVTCVLSGYRLWFFAFNLDHLGDQGLQEGGIHPVEGQGRPEGGPPGGTEEVHHPDADLLEGDHRLLVEDTEGLHHQGGGH